MVRLWALQREEVAANITLAASGGAHGPSRNKICLAFEARAKNL
jgi:hypothetical protein